MRTAHQIALWSICALLCLSSFAPGSVKSRDAEKFGQVALVGTWLKDDKAFKVRIDKQSERFYGKIIWLERNHWADGSPKKDHLNPDPKLRSRSYIGIPVVLGLKYDGDDTWNDGKIYDPESGKTYDCRITLVSRNRAEIRAYIGFPWIGKSLFFNRVEP
ncbi:MAG: DUF2147 domain-containing protein [Bacteroidetes bacterium]|nr:DUF2147 domain-containing protein [Bacteroidota bacterium]